MEIFKNSFYKFLIILILFFNFCKTSSYKKVEECNQIRDFANVIDFLLLEENEFLLFILNPNLRDYKNEIIHQSKILLIKKDKNKIFKIKNINILNRDDYPLKPYSASLYKKEKENFIYLINIAFLEQRSIEIYKLENENFVFQSRIRSKEFKNLQGISITKNQEILGSVDNKIFLYKNGALKYLNLKIPKINKIRKIEEEYFLISSKNKKILVLSEDLQIKKQLEFDFYPVEIFYKNGLYGILLNQKYYDFLYYQLNNPKEKNINNYLYLIPKDVFHTIDYYSLFESSIEKYLISNQEIYHTFSYIEFFLFNSWNSYSMTCEINNDFSRKFK